MRVYRIKNNIDDRNIIWKRRPSEIRGYQRTLYVNTEDGDYIRVDYNIKEKRVRLYIEDSEEGGNPYYAVIANGKISVERNATSGRVTKLHDKFSKRANKFSSITNNEVLRLINKNYGISGKTGQTDISKSEAGKKAREIERKKELEKTRKKYFKPDDLTTYIESSKVVKEIKKNVKAVDFFDFACGIILCLAVYVYNHNFVAMGMLSAIIGILMGFVDIFYRKRIPFFLKMGFFIVIGIVFYIYGYYIL